MRDPSGCSALGRHGAEFLGVVRWPERSSSIAARHLHRICSRWSTAGGPRRHGERGFTLVEVVMAIAVLTIALLGVAGALMVQAGGVAAGLSTGQAAITRGYYVSTATMLAQERLEQVRRLQYAIGPPSVDQIGAPTPVGFEDEAYGTIAGFPNFTREVRVQSGIPVANTKTVTVTVRFRLPTQRGTNTESLAMSTVVAARP